MMYEGSMYDYVDCEELLEGMFTEEVVSIIGV